MENQPQNDECIISEHLIRKPRPYHYYGIFKTERKGIIKHFIRYRGILCSEEAGISPFNNTALMPLRNHLLLILDEIEMEAINFDESIIANKLWETAVTNYKNDVVIIAYNDEETLLILFENQIDNNSLIYNFFLQEFYTTYVSNCERKSIQIFQC